MKNDNKKNTKNDINIMTIWKTLRSEKGKRYSFIIFYFFFFLFLFIIINNGEMQSRNNAPVEYSLPFQSKNLEDNNYNFKYIIFGDTELDYKGIKNNNIITIQDDTGEYVFTYQNGSLKSDYDIKYKELFDIYEIKRIIKNSKLISETKINETNEVIYNYTILSNKLDSILNNNVLNDLENEIMVKTNSKKEIININYKLLNYEKELNNDLTNFEIIFEVGDINE